MAQGFYEKGKLRSLMAVNVACYLLQSGSQKLLAVALLALSVVSSCANFSLIDHEVELVWRVRHRTCLQGGVSSNAPTIETAIPAVKSPLPPVAPRLRPVGTGRGAAHLPC